MGLRHRGPRRANHAFQRVGWECTTADTDQYSRSLASCFIEGEDVGKWMVRSGWALSFVRYSHAYDADEIAARGNRAGLWSGSFIAPWDWRHRNKTTTILGAASRYR